MDAPPRLSLAHATLVHLAPADVVRVAATTGYGAVGLRLIPVRGPADAFRSLVEQPGLLRDAGRALADTGVTLLDVEVFRLDGSHDVQRFLPSLEAAADLGARFVLANIYTPDAAVAEEHFTALCDLARPLGLTVALEFVSFSDVRTAARAVEMVRASRRSNAIVLVDTLHFHFSGAPASELSGVPSDLVRYVHVSDAPATAAPTVDDLRRITREGRLLPGEGVIDFAGILSRLPADVMHAVEVQNPARARALGDEAFARLACEATMRMLVAARRGDAPG